MNVTIDSASLHVAEPRDEHAGEHGADADENPDRDEELQRIVEVLAETVVTAAALGHQAERQSHQRAERGLDRSQEHRRAAEKEESKRRHAE